MNYSCKYSNCYADESHITHINDSIARRNVGKIRGG
jgi:hypothetical protein